MPTSAMKEEIARLLHGRGLHQGLLGRRGRAVSSLVIELKFGKNRERVITDLKRVSKPGRRVYAKKDRLPRVLGGLGTAILSTSTG
jgi:small subunit ribosomal protein S8